MSLLCNRTHIDVCSLVQQKHDCHKCTHGAPIFLKGYVEKVINLLKQQKELSEE